LSERIIYCIVDAYTYEGDALVVQMIPGRDFSGWDAFTELDANHKGSYEFVVMDRWQYEWVRCDDVVVESPRSDGPMDDRCALDCFRALLKAGYQLLAWRSYCNEAMPYMDQGGNTLPIEKRPTLKTLEEIEDTVKDSTVSELRKQILQLKMTARSKAIEDIRVQIGHCKNRLSEQNSDSYYRNQLRRCRGIVRETIEELNFLRQKLKELEVANNIRNKDRHLAEVLEGLLDKMALSAERRRSKYLELKAAILEKKLDLADEVKHFDALFKNYNDEKAKNGHTPRLVEIGSKLKSERDIIDETSIAIVRHNEELEAVEQYVMEGQGRNS
jgi:hypothetical protein